MLTPEQVAGLNVAFEQLTEPITEYLMRDIARRVSEAGQFTSTAAYQIWRAQNLGKSREEIEKAVAEILGKTIPEVRRLFYQSAEVGYYFDISHLNPEAIPFTENTSVQQIVSAAVQMAEVGLRNITQTMGFVAPDGQVYELTTAYQKACDFAFMQIITGASDYNTAIYQACAKLASRGIKTIDYASGIHTTLETAVRRNMMGGLGLMVEEISQKNHDDFGADGWEISAHAACAPDHEPIQGKQYPDKEYQALNNSLVRRIGTLNCGHNAFPILLGINAPQYTAEELEQLRLDNAKGVDYEGRHFDTVYDATQYQRQIERSIRAQKNRVSVCKAQGNEKRLQTNKIKLQRLREEYKRFCKATGLREQNERLHVSGFEKGWEEPKIEKTDDRKLWKEYNAIKKNVIDDSDFGSITSDAILHFKANQKYIAKDGEFNIEDAKNDYREFIESVPDRIRTVLQYAFDTTPFVETSDINVVFAYFPKKEAIAYNPRGENFAESKFGIAITHELGHRVDDMFQFTENNVALREAVDVAARTIENNRSKFVDYSWENDEDGFLSDIFSAVDQSDIFIAGHPPNYWEIPGNREAEIYANLFSLEAMNDQKKLGYLRKNFPEIMQEYDKMGFEV